jgi:cadmium resistance protein CadD (predicted permease)
MEAALSLIGLGTAAFALTDLDDLVLLIAFFADPAYRPRQIVAGQFAGMIALILASLVAALLGRALPLEWLGLLGLLPIGLGVKQLVTRDDTDAAAPPIWVRRLGRTAIVATVTIANGGDNLAIYVPLLAIHDRAAAALLAALFLALTGLWCLLAWRLARAGRRAVAGRAWATAAPVLFIALGLYILVKSGTLARLV